MTAPASVADQPTAFRPLDFPVPTPSGRPSWSGLLQLNLVGIPLKAYPAVRQREAPAFHQLHADCGQRIRCPKQCPVHGPVDSAALVRAYEYGPGQHVVLEADELDQLRPAQDRALRLEHFLSPAECDPLLYAGRSLYLLPDGPAAVPAYAVLQAVMVQRGRWAVGQLVLGGQRQVVLVRPAGGVLVLHVLHYPELVRAFPVPAAASRPAAAEELHLAGLLLDAASKAVAWSAYRDETAAELRALVEAKLQGQTGEAAAPAAVILPLLEALQQSVAAMAAPDSTTTSANRRGSLAAQPKNPTTTPAPKSRKATQGAVAAVETPQAETPQVVPTMRIKGQLVPSDAIVLPAETPPVVPTTAAATTVAIPTPAARVPPTDVADPSSVPEAAPQPEVDNPPVEVGTQEPKPDTEQPAPRKAPVRQPAGDGTKKVSALDAAARVLAETGQPMTCPELIGVMAAQGYWSSPGGKTPQATLYAAITKEIVAKGAQARFVKSQRGQFALRGAARPADQPLPGASRTAEASA